MSAGAPPVTPCPPISPHLTLPPLKLGELWAPPNLRGIGASASHRASGLKTNQPRPRVPPRLSPRAEGRPPPLGAARGAADRGPLTGLGPGGRSLSPLKYFRGGGLGLGAVGFRTRISKDFLVRRGGCGSRASGRGGLSRGDPRGLSARPPRSQGGGAPRRGLPPGDPDMQLLSLLERTMGFGARRWGGAELLPGSRSADGRPCQLLSSRLAPAWGAERPS